MSKHHLYLIGYRGSGKSVVAQLLADRLGRPMLDTDRIIEADAGKSIASIFENEGAEAFRDLEQQAIQHVSVESKPHIISLGGGAVLRPANQEFISKCGHVIWLQAMPETLYQRICSDSNSAANRPQLTDRTGYEEVESVLAERSPIYAGLADFSLATDCLSPEQVASEINDWLESAVH